VPPAVIHNSPAEKSVLLGGTNLMLCASLIEEVDCRWKYPDEQTALRGLLSSGPAIRAIQHAGEAAVRKAIVKAIAPFKTASGRYQIRNKYRYLIARA